jgi:putative SOS response-associated peptidase YedK
MCGRFTLTIETEAIERHYLQSMPSDYLGPSYNIAPSQFTPVVTHEGISLMRWGLVPQWASSLNTGYAMINAMSETVFQKPTYHQPIISGRCLIPASGFYEWLSEKGGKQPYYFSLPDNDVFSFAGLFVNRYDVEDGELQSFTILTTAANESVRKVHDRMPVILNPSEEQAWLDPDLIEPERIQAMLDPYPTEAMTSFTVGRAVGNIRNNSPALIAPLQ